MRMRIRFAGAFCAAAAVSIAVPPRRAAAFSQASPISPIGHEWITVASALDLLDEPLPTRGHLTLDLGKDLAGVLPATWGAFFEKKGKHAPNSPLNPLQISLLKKALPAEVWPRNGVGGYGARYYRIWSTVMGQRWVDTGGFAIVDARVCWDAVTQMGDDQQPDHFLRRRDDVGPAGAARAIDTARQRFKKAFIRAALADPDDSASLEFYDGGAVRRRHRASKAYFLFGRAAHLFQDSFSPEHGVRSPDDDFRTVRDIKSYVCTLGSQQHTHAKPSSAGHGDVVWQKNVSFDGPTTAGANWRFPNTKRDAHAAILAMSELWRAFLRVRAAGLAERPRAAAAQAQQMVDRWLSYDPASVGRAQGLTTEAQKECDRTVNWPAVATVERARCLSRIKAAGAERDEALGLPFDWSF